MKIVLAGGTGNIGRLLVDSFLSQGFEVAILTRSFRNNAELEYIRWDGTHIGDWTRVLKGADVLINMCGETITRRFTSKNKKVLEDSRLTPTAVLGEALEQLKDGPRLWINFSGISIYGGAKEIQDENGMAYGNDFLAQLTKQWEACFLNANTPRTKKVILRISAVLSFQFGMVKELYPLARLGLAGTVGNGKQLVSWIHQDDLVGLINWIISLESPRSIYHACSPHPVTNKEYMAALRQAVGVPLGIPLPKIFARIGAFIRGIDPSLLLQTVPVTTQYTVDDGFVFQFPYIAPSFNQLHKSRNF
ncbi:TIGR01777 family oxidoreductase [Sphingobacterium sp. JB170]|uniref:TIGR01777 family oxidoreductase n=1 Tax=Sphingobacterium sp. JB170 TaxID=1434842 RepID=UPI00097E9DF0|nr:TIGR01777 family oxidoreductase [Sphingobacterium sp. JB170]SJN15763.1 Cell division inhibitor [Sphingobacterium sp. JB170]